MPNDLADESRHIAEVTRRLSELSIDLAKAGRDTIRATHEKIECSRRPEAWPHCVESWPVCLRISQRSCSLSSTVRPQDGRRPLQRRSYNRIPRYRSRSPTTWSPSMRHVSTSVHRISISRSKTESCASRRARSRTTRAPASTCCFDRRQPTTVARSSASF
jgi:hypothetical protein